MTLEQLEKGQKLTEKIKELENHLNSVQFVNTDIPINQSGIELQFDPGRNYSRRHLDRQFYPVPVESFMNMYCLNVEKRIIELKEELVKL